MKKIFLFVILFISVFVFTNDVFADCKDYSVADCGRGGNSCKIKKHGKGYNFCTSDHEEENKTMEDIGSCNYYAYKGECESSKYFACVWVELNESINSNGGYCNTDNLQYVMCGDAFDIPAQVPSITSFVINLLKIATPIILIITSIISLVKALISSKEDEIKKAQNSLIKKMIAAAMVFFVITIVEFVVIKVAEDDKEVQSISNCLSCFINNDCQDTMYYKTNIGGKYYCSKLDGQYLNSDGSCPQDNN